MAISNSRRLNLVVPYLYPDLENGLDKDYYLQNNTVKFPIFCFYCSKSGYNKSVTHS